MGPTRCILRFIFPQFKEGEISNEENLDVGPPPSARFCFPIWQSPAASSQAPATDRRYGPSKDQSPALKKKQLLQSQRPNNQTPIWFATPLLAEQEIKSPFFFPAS